MLYLPQDPTPSVVFYCTMQVYGAFTDLLVLGGLITSAFNLGSGEWVGKDVKQANWTSPYSVVTAQAVGYE